MIDIILTVNKEKVYEEVAKTTSYTGAKMDDELAYDRIFTTDEDKCILERFWCESRNTICNSLKKYFLTKQRIAVNTDFCWGCRIHSRKF